jgi:hypothetical protein
MDSAHPAPAGDRPDPRTAFAELSKIMLGAQPLSQRLRELSQRSDVKLRDAAEQIILPVTPNSTRAEDPGGPSETGGGKVHDAADADGAPPAGGEGECTPWERERHARSWWISAEERETPRRGGRPAGGRAGRCRPRL